MSGVAEIRLGPDSLRSLHARVKEARTPLVWLLAADASPLEDALAALLERSQGPAASLPVDAHGRPVRALMGRAEESDPEATLDAIRRRSVPLRHVALTSLLVERDAVLELDAPDPGRFGWYAGAEWTARLFARRPGLLVPASRVRVDGCPSGSPLHVLRAARSAGWRRGETVRELHRSVKSSGG